MPSMTRATLLSTVGSLTGDPNHTRFTSALKLDRIQEAQERFVIDTNVLKDVNSTITTVAGTASYDLPTDILDVMRVSHKNIKLTRKSKYDLDVESGTDWSEDTGTPQSYYIDLDPNNKKIVLYPIPEGSDAGANLIIEYVKIPPTLDTDAAVPFDGHTLMAPYSMAIAYWASSKLLLIRPDQQALVMSSGYEKQYRELVADCIDRFKQMYETAPMRMRGGRYHKGL